MAIGFERRLAESGIMRDSETAPFSTLLRSSEGTTSSFEVDMLGATLCIQSSIKRIDVA
jgi:hypothetical protein